LATTIGENTGIEEQIGTLFRENHIAMKKAAYRITARRDYPEEGRKDAEDVVQNVFLHLLEKGSPEATTTATVTATSRRCTA
jgi:DNA-directed RNA polymerase specialized sigma24 family protein